MEIKAVLSFTLLMASLMVSGCAASKESTADEKYNAALRMEMQKPEVKSGNREIPCLVKVETTSHENINKDFKKCGVQIITSTKTIVSAKGKGDAIKCIAELDYVKRIELSEKKGIHK